MLFAPASGFKRSFTEAEADLAHPLIHERYAIARYLQSVNDPPARELLRQLDLVGFCEPRRRRSPRGAGPF